jgi:hypothetical protein
MSAFDQMLCVALLGWYSIETRLILVAIVGGPSPSDVLGVLLIATKIKRILIEY